MRLVRLVSGKYMVVTPAQDGQPSVVEQFLMHAAPDMQVNAKGMFALFKRYAMDGRNRFPSGNFHEANKEERIWEFIKGRLRVYCFVDSSGGLVVLSHGIVKKTQKADKQEVARALRLKCKYLEAKAAGQIVLTEPDEGYRV